MGINELLSKLHTQVQHFRTEPASITEHELETVIKLIRSHQEESTKKLKPRVNMPVNEGLEEKTLEAVTRLLTDEQLKRQIDNNARLRNTSLLWRELDHFVQKINASKTKRKVTQVEKSEGGGARGR